MAEEFARKWKKFSTDGLDKLMVIADFDYTLTPFYKPTGASEWQLCWSPVTAIHGASSRTDGGAL